MIKMKCQWFQLTAGNHREDPHQTGRLPAAGFRHSKCAAAAHPLQVIHEHHSGRNKLIVLTISTAVWWRCHSSSASTRSADSVAGIRSFPVMRRINAGHQRKKSSKSILSILSLWNMASSLQENWTTDRRCSLCPTTGWFIPIASLIASGARLEQLEATLGALHPIGHGH